MTSRARRKPRPSRKARSAARLGAVQALYQMEVSDQGSEAALQEFLDYRLGADIEGERYAEADAKFFSALVRGVVERQSEIDQALARDGSLSGSTRRCARRCGLPPMNSWRAVTYRRKS